MKNFLFVSVLISIISCEQKLRVDITDNKLRLENGIAWYDSSLFTGTLVEKHPNGSLKAEVNYSKGELDGLKKGWYLNGEISEKRSYKQNIKIGTHQGWWPNGKKKYIYHFNNQGQYEGNIKEWYSNGHLYGDFNYTKGKEAGRQKIYKTNGGLKGNYYVKDGERFGLVGMKSCYTLRTSK